MYVCTSSVPGVLRTQRRVLTLELKLQMVVVHHVAENQAGIPLKSSQKSRVVFPALTLTSCLFAYLVYNLKLGAENSMLLWYQGNKKGRMENTR